MDESTADKRRNFWFDLDLDGLVEGADPESEMEVQGFQEFAHTDAYRLFPPDPNYGSSMQRLFEEADSPPLDPNFYRKNSVPFIQESKEEEDEKKQPHPFTASPIPSCTHLPPPILRAHRDSLVEPIPEEDTTYQQKQRFLQYLDDPATVSLCLKQVKQKIQNQNTEAYSVEMLAQRISEQLCHNLLEKSISVTPLTLLSQEPPMEVSDFQLNPEESFITSGPLSSSAPSQKKKIWSESDLKLLEESLPQEEALHQVDWNMLAKELGKPVLSVYKKAQALIKENNERLGGGGGVDTTVAADLQISNVELIAQALDRLPGRCGTKLEIFQMIKVLSEEQGLNPRRESSLQQTLSTRFKRMAGFYSLTKEGWQTVSEMKKASTMKGKCLYVLGELGGRGSIKEIKEKMIELFEGELNHSVKSGHMSVWESTMLKVLKGHKKEIDSSHNKAVFGMDDQRIQRTQCYFSISQE